MAMLEALGKGRLILWLVRPIPDGVRQFCSSHKRRRRLWRNLCRPILVADIGKESINHEAELIRRTGLFGDVKESKDFRSANLLREHRLVILGYTSDKIFEKFLGSARDCGVPVIIYAKPGAISKKDIGLIQGYSHHLICNTPLRLVSDIFAIMATYPEEK